LPARRAPRRREGDRPRDLKPDNVFLARAPGAAELDVQVKLLDFGISKSSVERLTQTGELLGTRATWRPSSSPQITISTAASTSTRSA